MAIDSKLQEEIAKKYREAGYTVYGPSDAGIYFETSLGMYQPDFVAKRDNEVAIVEVVGNPNRGLPLHELATVIRQKGWRFDVVYAYGSNDLAFTTLSYLDIEKRLNSARGLLNEGDREVAFMAAWTAFEALLFLHQQQLGVQIRPRGPQVLIKEAISLGILEENDLGTLNKLATIRNKIVHGFASNLATETPCQELLSFAENLQSQLSTLFDDEM